ncbi:MAG TPA: hypothetical protein VKQ07_00915 [Jatrophihabitantaceae bacterium]|nr:hypothetical protein [Jatrophihabitantaceae bacterium]
MGVALTAADEGMHETGAAGVDYGYLERRVRDLLAQSDEHLRTSGA